MASKQGDGDTRSGFDRLMEEVGGYLTAQAGQLADKAVDKVGDLTDGLYDVAENGGSLAGVGGRLIQGDSPAKAVLGQTFEGIKDKVKDVGSGLLGGKGKGKGRKAGGKSMNIVETIDVGVPLRTAYDHWTRYEDFSGFAKGVRSVSQSGDTASDWKVKVGPSTRSWKATVQEQIPDDRIVWSSEGAKGTTRGCVSFHELAPSLTRILLVVEYYPSGLFEKTGNIWRAQGRRMRLDLKHFDRFVTLTDEEPDGWRGRIEDGEVVVTHEEAVEEEEREGEEDAGTDEEEADYPEDDENADAYEEEGEEEDEEEDGDAYEDEYGNENEDAYEDGDEQDEEPRLSRSRR
ncbi:SRPBCC family protein [Streptomyces sp. NPDC014656]|uniref:SRPBCC family protein n=1 Tax=Streptomyces sp. NPDC014656 TaxID=3364878 RepID=UPI0037035235